MPAAYNDAALENGGNWDWNIRTEVYRDAGFERSGAETKLASERIRAELGREITLRWIGENPEKLPRLFAVKVMTLWGSSRLGIAALALAAMGLCVARPLRKRMPLYAILLVYTFGVGLTWATGGRFRVPVIPLVFVLAADALVSLTVWIRGTKSS
jgi:hypothetical protein